MRTVALLSAAVMAFGTGASRTVGGLRKLRHRGGELVDWVVTFAAAAYNSIRLRTLLAGPA